MIRQTTDSGSSARLRKTGALVLLQALCAAALVSIPSLLLRSPATALPAMTLAQVVSLCASYFACVLVLAWVERNGRELTAGALARLIVVAYAPSLLLVALSKLDLPRRVLLAELLAGAALACLTAVTRRRPALRAGALLAVALAGVAIQLGLTFKKPPGPHAPSVLVWRTNSVLYPLRVTEYRDWFPQPVAPGGGMSPLGDAYLLATGDGDLYALREDGAGRTLQVKRLSDRVPINTPEFAAAAAHKVDPTTFRVADILVQQREGSTRIFATHHYWNQAQRCFVLRVSMLEGAGRFLLDSAAQPRTWRTVFESSPCVPIEFAGKFPHFGGIQIGGRMALLSDTELLVTVGDSDLDGYNMPISAPQDPASSYGKTVLIDLHDFASQVFSVGHRNPQGLYADGSGAIWLTEHGPQGGDELNLIVRGANYGWPLVTYGAHYGAHSWPPDAVPGSHEHFAQPYYSWVPSIGVSSLLVSSSPLFKLWNGDLVVSSLKDQALYRARIRESRVVMMERIPLGERIRDINEGREGELLLWTDSGALLVVRVDTDVGIGEAAFQVCSGCHNIDNGEEHGFGPDLFHIVNRNVASAAGFRYSAALRSVGGRWTRERLDAFLQSPQAFAPGTAMGFAGVSDATTRARIIDYLASSSNHMLNKERQH